MVYKAVMFDMGSVLIRSPIRTFFEKYHPNMKEPSEEEILRSLFHPDFVETMNAAERGEIIVEELETKLTEFCRKLFNKPDLPFLSCISCWREFMDKEDLRIPEMTEAVKKVRAKGLKVAVLTNNFWYDKEKTVTTLYIDRSLFDEVIESCVTGLIKPDKEIFEYALNKLDCKPEEVIFLDDFENNFKEARKMGIKTILVKRQEDAAAELLKLLDIP